MKTKYRDFTIEQTTHGFSCDFINCFACRTPEQVKGAIDRYLDGDSNPQCRVSCHCGKRLNENGLCWVCDPISTCWQQ